MAKRAGPTCAADSPTWWNNAEGATPCDVYQSVMDACGYTAPPISPGDAYYPVAQAQNCMCNTVAYNLGSACQDCQRGTTDQGILFSTYVAGGDLCPSTTDSLPDTVTPAQQVPLWALIDTSTQFWTYFDAQQVALNSSSTTSILSPTGTLPGEMSSTMDGSPTATTTDSPTSSPTLAPVQASHKSTNAGAIGGGVAAGVVVLLLVAGLLFWRRRRARSHDGPGMAMGAVADDGSRGPSTSDSSLTESGKIAASGGSGSHYTPHSQMAQLNNNGSGIIIPSYSTVSALASPVDPPTLPNFPPEYATRTNTPARSLAASPTPSAPAVQNKVKRVPVRYSEDELARAEQEEQKIAQRQNEQPPSP